MSARSGIATLSIRVVVAVLALTATRAAAQGLSPASDMMIDAVTRTAVIDGVLRELADYYVHPDIAVKMRDAVRQRQQRREYDAVTSARQLAESLTAHLREVSRDQHLAVNFSANVVTAPSLPLPIVGPTAEQLDRLRANFAPQNFGFQRVERLAGNIGYIDVRRFLPPAIMGDTAAAALAFLANTDALIIDMRENGGGLLESVSLLASFLFHWPTHVLDIHYRYSNETRQYWTLPVPGPRFVGKDVYILTSNRTFSAAEAFAYSMKELKRATIVGEVTRGGAHQPAPRRVNEHFSVGVPIGRIVSAVTHTDWEGVGVEPDVKVAAAEALATAHLMALEKQAQATLFPSMLAEVISAIKSVKASLQSQ